MSVSNGAGLILGCFLSAWFISWTVSAAIYGVKSIFWAAYGRNNQSV
jgi:hypothetical protein